MRRAQEDKLALFGALDTVVACLELVPAIVANAQLNRETIAARIEEGFLDATALMDQRQQLYFGRSTAYQTFVNNAYLINGDTALVAPKGTSVVWYEFYCSTGTLSGGRVDV